MGEMTVLLMALVGTVGVLVFSLLAVWYQKKYPPKEYDERQELARGEAAKLSVSVMLVYFTALFAAYGYRGLVYDAELRAIEVALAIMVGLGVALLVNHTCCLLTHAALPLGKKPLGTMVSFFLAAVMELLNYYLRCWLYPDSGSRMEGYIWLMCGVSSCYLGTLYLLQWLRNRKEARDGEE